MSSDLRTAIIENITIADFLRSEGYEVIPRGRKLTVKGHDSLSACSWCNHGKHRHLGSISQFSCVYL